MIHELIGSIIEEDIKNVPVLRQVCHRWKQLIDETTSICKKFISPRLSRNFRNRLINNGCFTLFGKCDILNHGSSLMLDDMVTLIKLKQFESLIDYLDHHPFIKIATNATIESKKYDWEKIEHPIVVALMHCTTVDEFDRFAYKILNHFFEFCDDESIESSIAKILSGFCELQATDYLSKETTFPFVERLIKYNLHPNDSVINLHSISLMYKMEKLNPTLADFYCKKLFNNQPKLSSWIYTDEFESIQGLIFKQCAVLYTAFLFVRRQDESALLQLKEKFGSFAFKNKKFLVKLIKHNWSDGLKFINVLNLEKSYYTDWKRLKLSSNHIQIVKDAKSFLDVDEYVGLLCKCGDLETLKQELPKLDPVGLTFHLQLGTEISESVWEFLFDQKIVQSWNLSSKRSHTLMLIHLDDESPEFRCTTVYQKRGKFVKSLVDEFFHKPGLIFDYNDWRLINDSKLLEEWVRDENIVDTMTFISSIAEVNISESYCEKLFIDAKTIVSDFYQNDNCIKILDALINHHPKIGKCIFHYCQNYALDQLDQIFDSSIRIRSESDLLCLMYDLFTEGNLDHLHKLIQFCDLNQFDPSKMNESIKTVFLSSSISWSKMRYDLLSHQTFKCLNLMPHFDSFVKDRLLIQSDSFLYKLFIVAPQ